ncbi:MAG: c-type cytochrome domain-containing protein [Bacteroidota bacterium]
MGDWALFIGRFHPVVVHLPIGALLVGALMAWLGRTPKFEGLRPATSFVLGFGALSAIAAAVFGWLLASDGGYNENALFWHRWLGIAVTALSIGTWLVYRGTLPLGHTLRMSLVGIVVVLLGFTGHLGGNLTHGEGYLIRYAPSFAQRLVGLDVEVAAALPADPDSIIVYTHLVQPVLDQTCVECHNTNKIQGGLLLTTPDQIDDGGDTGPVLIPGDPYESELIRRITLPQSDRFFMPPTGEALPYHDVRILQWWIEQGADYDVALADMEMDDEIEQLLRQTYGVDMRPKAFVEALVVPPAAPEALEALLDAGFAVQPLAQTSNLLDVRPRLGQTITPDAIALLADVSRQVTWLDLGGLDLADADVAPLAALTNLSRLRLDRNEALSDRALDHVVGLPNLTSLNLYGTGVTDQAVPVLAGMRSLRAVYLWQSAITMEGAARLRSDRPEMTVDTGATFGS